MRKSTYILCLFCVTILAFSCTDDSVSNEFEEANGKVEKKLIQSITIASGQDSQEGGSLQFSYTTDGALNTISNGEDTSIFVYDGTELANVTGGGDNLNIDELYESPYDAFETGNVLLYDSNGNPKKIEFFEEEYDYNSDTYSTQVYTAELNYDDAHNPFFYTLEAGGIIDVLDGVKLNFSLNPQVPEIVQARMLFPVNNLSQIIYKNEAGETMYTINVNYVYDTDNYATSGTVTAVSIVDGDQSTYAVQFDYVN
tara:strand:+ start:20957 stop:21721 length:765 start_codon:yes stop_codon:yes gene_type:complete